MVLSKWPKLSRDALWFLFNYQNWTLFVAKSDQHSTRPRHGQSGSQPPGTLSVPTDHWLYQMSSQELIWFRSSGKLRSRKKTLIGKGGVKTFCLCYFRGGECGGGEAGLKRWIGLVVFRQLSTSIHTIPTTFSSLSGILNVELLHYLSIELSKTVDKRK